MQEPVIVCCKHTLTQMNLMFVLPLGKFVSRK